MNIIEQAEHELQLLMLCKPSTVRGLIAEIQRLRELVKRHEDGISHINLSCIKCGGTDIHTAFHQKLECDYSCRNRLNSEHLHRTCRTCGYDWCDTPLDALGEQNGTI